MEDCGIIGPKDGAKDREILVNVDQFNFEDVLDQ
jgi:hypothetical protein